MRANEVKFKIILYFISKRQTFIFHSSLYKVKNNQNKILLINNHFKSKTRIYIISYKKLITKKTI